MSDALTRALDDVMADCIERNLLVGADIAVMHHGMPRYRKAWGWRDREARQAMTPGTIFRYASLTKAIISVAVLRLAEMGVIDLQAPVTRYLPTFQPALPSGEQPQITITHLLTHTAGLSYGFLQGEDSPYRRAGVSDGLDATPISNDENLRRLAQVPLFHAPGTHWEYSLATDVLGSVIEHVTYETLSVALRRLVTEPAGMHDTGFRPTDRSRVSVPYLDGNPLPQRMQAQTFATIPTGIVHFGPERAWTPGTADSGGAGLFGSADDYVRFLELLRNGGAPLLGPDSMRLLVTHAIGDLSVSFLGPGWGFGLGVAVLQDPVIAATPQAAGTWLWSGAYGNHWFVDPVNVLSVVILTNTAFAGMAGPVPDRIRDAIYAHL
ncbi:serine hydrolase domain-containing protein [Klebsiella pneumoniae]|nr:beta-lactamase family protein [Klebsiella pneumoniae]